MADTYDVVIIGGGPGGYNCAIRAGQLGLKTAIIEKRGTLGGTCLNVGCIPSKALLHASELFESATNDFAALGIKTGKVEVDLPAMMKQKDDAVNGLTQGIEFLMKKNKVDYIKGTGKITGKGKVEIAGEDGKTQSLDTKNKKLILIGAGVIGLELGSVWSRLGADVTVVEYLDRIMPGADTEVAKDAQRIFKKQGLDFRLGMKVTGVETQKSGVKLSMEPAKGGDPETLEADVVIVAVGRRPYTEGLGLESVGGKTDKRGVIEVTDHFKVADGVWAVGDCIPGPMLAHKAEDDGGAVAELIAGKAGHVDYDLVPSVVYTNPEIAWVGKTEEQLKDAGIEYKKGKFPFQANSRARTNHETLGFVKILADAKTDKILGAHMMGVGVGEMIHEICVAMEFGASSEDVARTCHAHPTMSEAVRQAAMGVEGWTMQM